MHDAKAPTPGSTKREASAIAAGLDVKSTAPPLNSNARQTLFKLPKP